MAKQDAHEDATARLPLPLIILGIGILLLLIVFGIKACSGNSNSDTQADINQVSNLRATSGVVIEANKSANTLSVNRRTPSASQPSNLAANTWTIFVYVCGSDLESQSAAASMDFDEMIKGSGSANVRFVIETGGTNTWRNNIMKPNQLGRYLIQQGSIQDLGAVSRANMGEAQTLAEFISWGLANYPSERMALIFWDHGGGSLSGVCFDEQNGKDSLSLRELDAALNANLDSMWDTFDFIGFDACLMGTLETANIVASYADYMIASQESEPGGGWEYSSIVKYLSQNPTTSGTDLGNAICNSYKASVERNMKEFVTLSVVDLSKIDTLIQDFYTFSQEMYDSGSNQKNLATMTRNIQQADNYGVNNRREGFTNMVDLGGLVNACASVAPSAAKVQQSLQDAIVYQVKGTYHADASGLSTYYPLAITSSQELSIFQTVAVSPSYISYIDRLAHGATYNGGSQYQQYSSDSIWNGNFWSWLLGNSYEEIQQQAQQQWGYVDEHEQTSTQISFLYEPQVDEEGTLWFQFDESGLDRASVVSGLVYQRDNEKGNYIAHGETYDVYGDWETGEFADGFDGRWLSLPDGQALDLSVVSSDESRIIYAAPIELNGRECYLRMVQDIASGSVVVEGAWNGLDASGSVDRGLSALKRGDSILPLYRAIAAQGGAQVEDYEGEVYKLNDDTLAISYDYLPEGDYLYSFMIQDVFGDSYLTGAAQFEIDSDGNIWFI